MTATAVNDRTQLPSPTWPRSAPSTAALTTSFPRTDCPVVLADDPCEAGLPGAGPEYAGICLHARYFDPKLGTFLSPDPIGVAGGMNEYGYASGDPVNRKDPSGLTDCQKSRTSTNGGPWGSWTYYGNCSASDMSPLPYLRTSAYGMWPMLPFLHNLPNYQGPGTHLRPGEGNKTQETTQADPPVGGEGQSSSGTNGASGGDSRTTSGVNGALSSISDSFKSIGDTWVGLATEDWDLVNRAYDYGPLGQTDDAGGVYYYGTRVGVYGAGAAGLTAGGLIVAEATGLTVIGSRPMQFFGNLGPEWHVGLEWATKKSVVHFGRHTVHGVHVAFGAVGPMVANFHIYLYPQVRFWWPGK